MKRSALKTKDLQRESSVAQPLSISIDIDRLLCAMAWWWDGWSWSQIAREFGVSRQRVGIMLAQVGCTRRRWCQANHDRPDSAQRAAPGRAAKARATLAHSKSARLTVRQRAALAWLAQGLRQTDIAKRMVTTPQNVRNLLVAAEARLARLSRPRHQRAAIGLRIPRTPGEPTPPPLDIDLDWQGLLADFVGR